LSIFFTVIQIPEQKGEYYRKEFHLEQGDLTEQKIYNKIIDVVRVSIIYSSTFFFFFVLQNYGYFFPKRPEFECKSSEER